MGFIIFQGPRLTSPRCDASRTIFLGTRVQRRRVQRPGLPLDEVKYAFTTTRIIPESLALEVVARRTCNLHAASPDLQAARIIDESLGRFEVEGTHD